MDRQMQIQKAIEIDEVAIDPVPVQLILGTSLYKVHTLFSLLSLNHAYVTYQGQLVGVVGLKEVSGSLVFILEDERRVQRNNNQFIYLKNIKSHGRIDLKTI